METQILRAHPIGPAPVTYYGECRDCRAVSPAYDDPVPAIRWVQAHVAAAHTDRLAEWRGVGPPADLLDGRRRRAGAVGVEEHGVPAGQVRPDDAVAAAGRRRPVPARAAAAVAPAARVGRDRPAPRRARERAHSRGRRRG